MNEKPSLMDILTQGSPLSVDLVCESWPFLSLQEKRTILSSSFQILLFERVLGVALEDPNPMVRWMASNHVRAPDEYTPSEVRAQQQALWEKVKSDPVAFVRDPWKEKPSTPWWSRRGEEESFERFWSLPRYVRLLEAHQEVNGVWLCGSIQHLIATRGIGERVPMVDVDELLLQYFVAHDFTSTMRQKIDSSMEADYYSRESDWEECKAWWSLVSQAKEWPWIVSTLLRFLNEDGCTLETLESLDSLDLELLLSRDEFDPNGHLRQKLFRQSSHQRVRKAALSCPTTSFADHDLIEFLPSPMDPPDLRRRKLIDLHILEDSYAGGSLAQLAAIVKYAKSTRKEYIELIDQANKDWDRYIPPFAEHRVKRLSFRALAKEVRELRVFLLSKDLIEQPAQDLKRFGYMEPKIRAGVVPGSIWETYLHLISIFDGSCSYVLIQSLPEVDEYILSGIPAVIGGGGRGEAPRKYWEVVEAEVSASGGASSVGTPSSNHSTLSAINERLASLERASRSDHLSLLWGGLIATAFIVFFLRSCH